MSRTASRRGEGGRSSCPAGPASRTARQPSLARAVSTTAFRFFGRESIMLPNPRKTTLPDARRNRSRSSGGRQLSGGSSHQGPVTTTPGGQSGGGGRRLRQKPYKQTSPSGGGRWIGGGAGARNREG